MTETQPGALDSFADELRAEIQRELQEAEAVETLCWLGPLRDASRMIGALPAVDVGDARSLAAYSAHASELVFKLQVSNEAWPLPELLGRAAANIGHVVDLAVDELQLGEDPTYSAFREAFHEKRNAAFRSVVMDATTQLTELVRALQGWHGAMTIAFHAAELDGEAYGDELQWEVHELGSLLRGLLEASNVALLRSALLDAVDEATATGSAVEDGDGNSRGTHARRQWSRSLVAAQATLRRPGADPLPQRWSRHHEGLWLRVTLLQELFELHATLATAYSEGLAVLEQGAVEPVVTPLAAASSAMRDARGESEQLQLALRGDWSQAVGQLQRIRTSTGASLRSALAALEDRSSIDVANTSSDRSVAACQAAPGVLRDRIVTVSLEDRSTSDWPLETSTVLTPREWAERALDMARMTSGRVALMSVADELRSGVQAAQKAPEVLAYNIDAALDEMRALAAGGVEQEDPWELAHAGLDRSADYLDRIVEAIEEAHTRAARVLWHEIGSAHIELLGRLSREDDWTAELSDSWSEAVEQAQRVSRGVQVGSQRAVAFTGRTAGAAFARSRAVLERARRLISGGSPASVSEQTLRELWSVDLQPDHLPFVYRRLFSPRPVDDPTLFVGRDSDLDAVQHHWEDWCAGRSNTLVLSAPFGGSMRSLLTAAAARSGERERWRRATLPTRVLDERVLSRRLADSLFSTPTDLPTLAALSEAVLESPPHLAVHVERLEYAFERTVEGFDLVEALFEFFSRTDSAVAWFATTTTDSWRLLTTAVPGAVSTVRHREMAPLDRDGLASMLRARHDRSGLALRYDEGSVPAGAKRDTRSPELLEQAFFDQFWELADGSAPLALLYWVRSASHQPESEHIDLTWPQALDFGFLDDLTWDQAFTLQAIVEHGSLRVDEHARVFSTAPDRSYETLESLGNRYLIEPAGITRRIGAPPVFDSVQPDVPYQIRPVLLPVVRRVLRGRRLTR